MSTLDFFVLLIWLAAVGYLIFSYSSLSNALRRVRAIDTVRRSGSPAELGDLNQEQFIEATRDLEALGFEFQGEHLWSVVLLQTQDAAPLADPSNPPPLTPNRIDPQGFERVFSHPTYGCWGTINFAAGRDTLEKRPTVINFVITISSSTGHGEDDWNYLTRDKKYDAVSELFSKLWRQPRGLSTIVANASAAQLLEFHLARREQIARAAGISWQRSLTIEDYLALESRQKLQMRTVFNKFTTLQMYWQISRLKRERESAPPEWLGELKGRLK